MGLGKVLLDFALDPVMVFRAAKPKAEKVVRDTSEATRGLRNTVRSGEFVGRLLGGGKGAKDTLSKTPTVPLDVSQKPAYKRSLYEQAGETVGTGVAFTTGVAYGLAATGGADALKGATLGLVDDRPKKAKSTGLPSVRESPGTIGPGGTAYPYKTAAAKATVERLDAKTDAIRDKLRDAKDDAERDRLKRKLAKAKEREKEARREARAATAPPPPVVVPVPTVTADPSVSTVTATALPSDRTGINAVFYPVQQFAQTTVRRIKRRVRRARKARRKK